MEPTEQLKLVVLTSRFPYPLEKGDKLRIYHQIRLLSQYFRVVLVSLHEGEVPAEDKAILRQYCENIYLLKLPLWRIGWNLIRAFLNRESLQVGYFYSPKIQQLLEQIIQREQPDRVYAQLIRSGKYVQHLSIPKTIDFMDVFSGQMKRRAEHSRWPLSYLFRREARKMSQVEQQLFTAFDHATIISDQDRLQLGFPEKEQVVVVPNGINTQYFQPQGGPKKYDLVFVGNMGYHPNVVAAQYLVKKIMPLVWQQNEQVSLLLAGARPRPEVKRLAGERVTISGWLDDIREAYDSGRIFVAPLFLGSGQQNKILEAMSMGLPCLTSPMVNNAIGGTENVQVLLANDEQQFAEHILALLTDPERCQKIGHAAAAFVYDHFSWEQSVEQLLQTITTP